jgi:hypothetical protein
MQRRPVENLANQEPANKRDEQTKTCFVISPIADEDSEIRNYADMVFEFIIKPAVEKHSYKPIRADQISKPGIITSDIVDRLLKDDLVIADLTLANPNVTYELAIRHMIKGHVIQIKDSYGQLPFDIQPMRTILFRFGDTKSMLSCREAISDQVQAIKNGARPESPISQSVILHALEPSKEPMKEYLQQLELRLNSKIDNIEARVGFHPKVLQPGEAPPFSGQTVFIDPSRIKLDPSLSLGGVVVHPNLSNIKPTVLGGQTIIGDSTFLNAGLKKSETKKDNNK